MFTLDDMTPSVHGWSR